MKLGEYFCAGYNYQYSITEPAKKRLLPNRRRQLTRRINASFFYVINRPSHQYRTGADAASLNRVMKYFRKFPAKRHNFMYRRNKW
jgi:hypothetical protein